MPWTLSHQTLSSSIGWAGLGGRSLIFSKISRFLEESLVLTYVHMLSELFALDQEFGHIGRGARNPTPTAALECKCKQESEADAKGYKHSGPGIRDSVGPFFYLTAKAGSSQVVKLLPLWWLWSCFTMFHACFIVVPTSNQSLITKHHHTEATDQDTFRFVQRQARKGLAR